MELNNLVKEKVEQIAEKIKADPTIAKNFKDDPTGVVEKLLDIDLPDQAVQSVVTAVKAAIGSQKAADVLDAIKKLF